MLRLIPKGIINTKYHSSFPKHRSFSSKNEAKAQVNLEIPGLKIQTKKNILWIEFDRPKKFNAITWEMYEGITSALHVANDNDKINMTVITGNGLYYCSGNDLTNFVRDGETPADMRAMAEKGERYLERYVRAHIQHDKPLVSLVNGPAVGISVTVLALFDLVLSSDKATFHTPFTNLAQSPEGCSSYTFPMMMGPSKACEMLVFNKRITAVEALERNLITQIIPHERFRTDAVAYIEKIAQLPPESLRTNKVVLRNVHREALLKTNIEECKVLKSRWLSEECQQRLQAFLGSRK